MSQQASDERVRTISRAGVTVAMEVESGYERQRVDSFFSKEPETIRWIDELMRPGDCFYDVGANVGVFTLYAALRHGPSLDVRSFEPAYHNYHRLCRNLALNGTRGVRAYCVALGAGAGAADLRLASNESGSASHAFSGGRSQRADANTALEQGCLTLPLDALVAAHGLPHPHHIKVDIDGYEESFLAGAARTLADSRLRSVLIEVTHEDGSGERIGGAMHGFGFHAEHALNFAAEHSRNRRRSAGNAHIENVIYTR